MITKTSGRMWVDVDVDADGELYLEDCGTEFPEEKKSLLAFLAENGIATLFTDIPPQGLWRVTGRLEAGEFYSLEYGKDYEEFFEQITEPERLSVDYWDAKLPKD